MPQFSLTQLLMDVALVAILLTFTQCEGCGRRFTMIECLSFSHDGSGLLVSKLDARDARTHLKNYKTDVARTVSVLNVERGTTSSVVQQDVRTGNQGPAFRLWRFERTSAASDPSGDLIVVHEFGGGAVTTYSRGSGGPPRILKSLGHPVLNITISRTDHLAAVSGHNSLTVVDIVDDVAVSKVQIDDMPFLSAALMSFSNDNSTLATAGMSGVQFWNIKTGKRRCAILDALKPWVWAISFLPDDSLLVCSDEWLRQYDLAGNIVRTFSDADRYYACDVSPDGQHVAAVRRGGVDVFDVGSGERLHFFSPGWTTCLAFSPDGSLLAVGDFDGAVRLYHVSTGQRRWMANPPGRYRSPWTVPSLGLALWSCLAWRLAKRAATRGEADGRSPSA